MAHRRMELWSKRRRSLAFAADESFRQVVPNEENGGAGTKVSHTKSLPQLPTVNIDRYAMRQDFCSLKDSQVLIFEEDEYERQHIVEAFNTLEFQVQDTGELKQSVNLYNTQRDAIDLIVIGLKCPGYKTLHFLDAIAPIKIPVVLILPKDEDKLDIVASAAAREAAAAAEDEKEAEEEEKAEEGKSLAGAHKRGGFGSKINELVDFQAAVDMAYQLGITLCTHRPINNIERLRNRLLSMMQRFKQAANEFKEIMDLTDPDFATKQAKKLVLQEHARKEKLRQLKRATMLTARSRALKNGFKSTLDVRGTTGNSRAQSKFAMVLKRSKAVHKAKKRVERASLYRRLEAKFTTDTSGDEARGARSSKAGLERKQTSTKGGGDVYDTETTERLNSPVCSRGVGLDCDSPVAARLAMTVITKVALKRNQHEGTLPLLLDFCGNLSNIQLPWEADRQQRIIDEYGRMPKRRVPDILQVDFRELVPATKCATSGQRFLQKGYELKQKGDLTGAIRLYTRATQADQRYTAAHLCRGVAYYLMGDEEAAVKDLTTCLKIDPKSTYARFNLALIWSNQGDDLSAVRELNEAIAADDKDEELYSFRAFIYRRCGEFGKAQKDYKYSQEIVVARERARRLAERNSKRSSNLGDDDDDTYGGTSMQQDTRLNDENGDGRVDLSEFAAANELSDSVFSTLFQMQTAVEEACAKPPDKRTATDLRAIMRAAREIIMFRTMPQRLIREMCREVTIATVMPGEYVIQQGTESMNFFALLDGTVTVTLEVPDLDTEHVVHTMTSGECFGETSLITGSKRAVNIVVPENSSVALLFVIPQELFFRTKMNEYCRKDHAEIHDVLSHCKMFSDLPRDSLGELTRIARNVQYPHNSVILRQGEKTSRFCILLSGICKTLTYSDPGAEMAKKAKRLEQELEQFEMAYVVHHSNTQNNSSDAIRAQNRKKKAELIRVKQKLENMKNNAGKDNANREVFGGRKLLHMGTLYPGNIFGEEALLDPFYGREQYTVVADTYVKILIIHKEQLHTYSRAQELLENVRRKKLMNE